MRQRKSTTLYVFIAFLILVGLVLFLFKDAIFDQLLNANNTSTIVTPVKSSIELKIEILQDARIKALKSYVSVFDYNNLDKSQEIILANANKQGEVVISNPEEIATSSSSTKNQLIRVRVGNSNPFLVNKATK